MSNATSIETSPSVIDTEDDFPIVNHYVPKWEITESIVTGCKVTALCGERYVVNSQGNGEVSASGRGSVICPLCGTIYDGMGGGHAIKP